MSRPRNDLNPSPGVCDTARDVVVVVMTDAAQWRLELTPLNPSNDDIDRDNPTSAAPQHHLGRKQESFGWSSVLKMMSNLRLGRTGECIWTEV